MENKALILTIVICALGLASIPFLYFRVSPGSLASPTLALPPAGEQKCIEPKGYMRERHMCLLRDWRKLAMPANHGSDGRGGRAKGNVKYVASDGAQYDMSLTTCISCHSSKAEFCDRCHEYVPVRPACWKCHSFSQKRAAAE